MTLRFLKDYRSRAWMCRYAPGAVVEITNPAVIDECLAGGFAEPVDDVVADPVLDEPDADPIPEND